MESGIGTGKQFGWHRLLQSTLGWNPEMEFLPALPAAIILYLSVYLIGQFLHATTKLLIPHPLKNFVLDFVKTMTFCAYPFGHGIIRKYYGEPGYLCAMVPLVMLTVTTMRGGSGNPVDIWLSYFRKTIPLWQCCLRCLIQIFAGFSAFHLGMYVLNLELHPMYVARLKNYYSSFCTTDLKVPIYMGFLIELCGVIYTSWLEGQILSRNALVDTFLKVLNAGFIVTMCVHLTGMYMHPAMATGHTWGCGDTTRPTHILIYWVGPMIGAWLGVQLSKKFSLKWHKKSSEKAAPSREHNGSGEVAVNGQVRKRKISGKRKFFAN